jgi:hypothetical protein
MVSVQVPNVPVTRPATAVFTLAALAIASASQTTRVLGSVARTLYVAGSHPAQMITIVPVVASVLRTHAVPLHPKNNQEYVWLANAAIPRQNSLVWRALYVDILSGRILPVVADTKGEEAFLKR